MLQKTLWPCDVLVLLCGGQLAQMSGGGGRWRPKSSLAFQGPLRLAKILLGGQGVIPGCALEVEECCGSGGDETPAVFMVSVACQTDSPDFINDDLV